MTVIERIRAYADAKHLCYSKVENDLGKAKSYLSQVKNMSSDVLVRAAERYPDLSMEWVVRGVGQMLLTDKPQDKTLERKIELLTERLVQAQKRIIELEIELEARND